MGKNTSKEIKNTSTQSMLAIGIITFTALIIGIIYIGILFTVINSNSIYTIDIIMFIKIFDLILSVLAIGSCILCYTSTKKEELFIISLIHIIFFVDIILGNIDSISISGSQININSYIFMATSLLRISILLISISRFNKIKTLIVKNKVISIVIIFIISLAIGILKINNMIDLDFKDINNFIIYNILLTVVYIIATIAYLIKSIRHKEYIYSVISASTFIFTFKWIYSIFGALNTSANINLVSISITYIGFIVFIGGIICELILSIQKNKELERELSIFKQIADENKHQCMYIYDELENIKYANDAAKIYFTNNNTISNNDLIKERQRLIDDIDKDIIIKIEECVRSQGQWRGSIKLLSRDITLSCRIQKLYLDNNKENTVVIFNDISEKLKEKKYMLEYEKIKSQEQIRSEFFANISHELRTPLNIFYSTTQLLDMKVEKDPDNFITTYLNNKGNLKTNCHRMLRLINNIVDITKIDVGFTKPTFINYDIVRLVEDITLSIINYAKLKNINIVFDTDIEEHIIQCDVEMIERVMLNLLSNAIKFTRKSGNIVVSIQINVNWIHITVEDDGIGIPIEIQERIFDRFVQSDKSLTRLNEGSGIGLSIVHSIVKLNGGEVSLKSDGENGSEFKVLLPNKKLDGDIYGEEVYTVDVQRIELELSDIYELYK
ncbi:MAG: HAMP domain-containing sensor histidine kinase [Romboutsia sp.]